MRESINFIILDQLLKDTNINEDIDFLLSNDYLLKDITEKIVSDYFLYKVVDRSEITSLKCSSKSKKYLMKYLIKKDFVINVDSYDFTNYYNDSIKTYLNESISVTYYSEKEEKKVFQRIAELNKELSKNNNEEIKKEIKELKEDILKHFYRNIILICKRNNRMNLDINDLMQYSLEITIKLIDSFDLKKHYRFSTYLNSYLPFLLKRNLDKYERPISISFNMIQNINKYLEYVSEYEKRFLKKPSDEIILKKLEINEQTLKQIKSATKIKNIYSLESYYQNDESSRSIVDKTNISKNDIDEVYRKETNKIIKNILSDELSGKKLFFYTGRYGILNEEPIKFNRKDKPIVIFSILHDKEYINNYLKEYNVNDFKYELNKIIDLNSVYIYIISEPISFKKISDICDCSNKYIYQIINVENQRLKYIFKNREHLYK